MIVLLAVRPEHTPFECQTNRLNFKPPTLMFISPLSSVEREDGADELKAASCLCLSLRVSVDAALPAGYILCKRTCLTPASNTLSYYLMHLFSFLSQFIYHTSVHRCRNNLRCWHC